MALSKEENDNLAFGHLHVHTEYSFLDGATPLTRLAAEAARMGQPFLAMTDHDSAAGVVKFHAACRQYGVQPITGAEVTMEESASPSPLAGRAGVGSASPSRFWLRRPPGTPTCAAC
ncbi:MAG: PHP domain-containing protein [Capsulimonadaceae bacterium]